VVLAGRKIADGPVTGVVAEPKLCVVNLDIATELPEIFGRL